MRIATWNVNSLKAHVERVLGWIERARPDVLLLQETKLHDDAAPHETFASVGYTLAHHGEGRWNGVAIASRIGLSNVVTNFGRPFREARTSDAHDDEPLAEARMMWRAGRSQRRSIAKLANGSRRPPITRRW